MGTYSQFFLAWLLPALALSTAFVISMRLAYRPIKPRGVPMLVWCLFFPLWMDFWLFILQLLLPPSASSGPLPMMLGFAIPSIVTTALAAHATRSTIVAVAGVAATLCVIAGTADSDGLGLVFALIGWHILFDAALLTWGILARAARFRLRYIHTCPKCGYDLQSLPDPICPECGTRGHVGWREGQDP